MKQIRLSGSGGQGVILAAIILAEAAVLEGKYAIQTQAYGPEARGGASKAEVIIAEERVAYPKVTSPDIVLALNQESCDKFGSNLKKGDILIVDTTFVQELPETEAEIVKVPITELARKELGRELFSNIIALGALVGATQVVEREFIEKAVLARVPKGTEEKNMKALELGFSAVN